MTNTQEKRSLETYSAMNNKATSIQKHDLIIIKNHPDHEGQMYCVGEVKRDGSVITNGGHIFYPEFFDKISNWEEYRDGFARFNQATGELVDEKDIKKYLEERWKLDDGKDGWVDEIVIAGDVELDLVQVREWLADNADMVEGDGDGGWRLITVTTGNKKPPNVLTNEKSQIVTAEGGRPQAPAFDAGEPATLESEPFVALENAETLQDFEQIIRDNLKGFYLVGRALIEIRDRCLYVDQKNINTFEQYCKSPLTLLRLGISSKGRAYQFMGAANVLSVLEKSQIVTQFPKNEGQIRPLVEGKLNNEQIVKAWNEALEQSPNKPPTGAIVKDVVRQIKEEEQDKLKLENPYSVGDVLRFNNNGDPQTRSRNKRWVIVGQVNEYSCTVSDFEGEFNAHINQLERLEVLSEEERIIAPQLRDRLAAIDTSELLVKKNVEYFAKLDRISLSEKEEAILKVLEK